MSQRDNSRRKTTAYHEAGHALIGRVLNFPSGGATIKPNYKQGSWGVAHVEPPGVCLLECKKRGKLRDLATAERARIMVYMAGAETEAELLGRTAIGDGDDRLQIGMMAEELACPDFWERLGASPSRHDAYAGATTQGAD
jgi:hypothetical protein